MSELFTCLALWSNGFGGRLFWLIIQVDKSDTGTVVYMWGNTMSVNHLQFFGREINAVVNLTYFFVGFVIHC